MAGRPGYCHSVLVIRQLFEQWVFQTLCTPLRTWNAMFAVPLCNWQLAASPVDAGLSTIGVAYQHEPVAYQDHLIQLMRFVNEHGRGL
jgi:hypothetical protein